MNNKILKSILTVFFIGLTLSACKKNDPPVPDEQELITTVKVNVSNSSGFNKEFIYKVENGFNSTTPGTLQIDTVKLPAGQTFDGAITIWNEKASPVENITEEILEKDEEHLFLYRSEPVSGAGSISVSEGSKDHNGKPFNQVFKITSGAAGQGKLTIDLMHQPVNKEGLTPATSGGETDAEAVYPVLIQ